MLYGSSCNRASWFSFFLSENPITLLKGCFSLFGAIYGLKSLLGILNDSAYVSKIKDKCNETLSCTRSFIKSKFENFDNNSEVKKFVDMKIDSIDDILTKMEARIEKA